MDAAGKHDKTSCAAIIFAAGQSTRLGKPKQLLQFQGKTLLQNSIDSAKQAGLQPVIVVLGSNMELILSKTDTDGLTIVKNEHWQTGMASSIVVGINTLENAFSSTEAVILMVCDQPYADGALLQKLISEHQNTQKPIVASKYDSVLGVPVLLHRSLFKALMDLEGDSGARKIIQQYADVVEAVPFPRGSIDVDTLADYEKLT